MVGPCVPAKLRERTESVHRRNVSGASALFNVPPLTSAPELPVQLGADDGADGEHHRTKRDIGAIS